MLLDAVIVVLLLATIVMAARLSFFLKRLRDDKDEMRKLMKELSTHIGQADETVKTIVNASDRSIVDLENQMSSAKMLSGELELIIQSGNSLANRIEDLAIRTQSIRQGRPGDIDDLKSKLVRDIGEDYEDRLNNLVKNVENADVNRPQREVSPFSIRDPEMERGEAPETGFTADDDVLSDAERDLHEAIARRQNKNAKQGRAS